MATLLPHVTCVGNHGKHGVKHCGDGVNLALTTTLLLGCNLKVMVLRGLSWLGTQGKIFSSYLCHSGVCRLKGGGEPARFHSISQEGTQFNARVQHIEMSFTCTFLATHTDLNYHSVRTALRTVAMLCSSIMLRFYCS